MSIDGIYISPKSSEPMQKVDTANLLKNQGIEGDRYCHHKGTYSALRVSKLHPGEREPGRQLTILSKDGVLNAFARKNLTPPESLGNLRRNIIVKGISSEDLLNAIGKVIELGSGGAKVLVHRHCVPCMYNERKNGIPGMMESIWMEAGVSCQVLEGGSIAINDCVTISPLEKDVKLCLDPGDQFSGYYVPPSKRSAEMVKNSLNRMKDAYKTLIKTDPEGIKRGQDAYASVGLKLWPKVSTS